MEEWLDMFLAVGRQIGIHMMEPLGYLPWGILAGAVFLVLEKAWHKGQEADGGFVGRGQSWTRFVAVVYTAVLINLTYLSREPGSRIGISLELFQTWGDSVVDHSYFIENIILFIPFGILFPMVFPILRKGWSCILTGFLFSVMLEFTQLITGRGFCQLDDVMTNTVGAGIGWGCYRLLQCRKKRRGI